MDFVVQPLARVHWTDLLRIEQACFPRPWPEREFKKILAGSGVRCFVVEVEGRARAFFVVQIESSGLRVLNLAVDPPVQRLGLGSFMLEEIEALAHAEERPRIELEVHETNLGAQLLYRQAGYRVMETLQGHYGREDGYRMCRELALQPCDYAVN